MPPAGGARLVAAFARLAAIHWSTNPLVGPDEADIKERRITVVRPKGTAVFTIFGLRYR